ncbi:MAG: DUF2125 domain-containing protein [Roseicyclus sp.]
MSRTKLLPISLSAIALSVAAPAFADVTAVELWAEWQTQSATMGQVLSATEVVERDGGLTLSGFTTTFSDGEVSTVGRIDEIVMTDNADGTVSITMSDTYALTISFIETRGAPPANVGVDLLSENLLITVGGVAGARSYDYSASSITVVDGPLTGGSGPPPIIDMEITLSDLVASYLLNGSDPDNMSYTSTSSFSGARGILDVTPPPNEDGHLKFSFSVGAVEGGGSGTLGNFLMVSENPDLVPAGFDLNGQFTYDRVSYEVTLEHPRDPFAMFYSNDGGAISATFSETELDYALSAAGAQARVIVPDLPFPIEAQVGSAEASFRIPLAPGDAPQDVSARLAYQDVTFSAQLWNMMDPMQAFPRDPITVIADLTGAVQVTANILAMDPENMAAPPGELRELSLNELRISVGGAELSGTGDMTFAPGQAVPMPVGAVDLRLAGGNALLDRLQQSGLVPIEQLAMARGMLGAFARPGATPDTLESTIQFSEGGGISANGVPLR